MNDWFKERGIGQEQVAATLNVSVSTVSRIVNYKRDLSMRRAMILHTEYGIPFDVMYPSQLSEGEGVETARMLGYGSLAWFSRRFHALTGQTPGAYRRAPHPLHLCER